MAANSVAKVLQTSAELYPLREQLDAIQRLQRRYRTVAPGDLAKASRVCAIEGTTVVIRAASGPVAAALRQVAPRILAALRATPRARVNSSGSRNALKENENRELTGIRVEVQVEAPPPARRARAREPLPAEQIARLADGLSDSPLKETLKRMGRTPQSRSTREKT
jgi:hypothetical protein